MSRASGFPRVSRLLAKAGFFFLFLTSTKKKRKAEFAIETLQTAKQA